MDWPWTAISWKIAASALATFFPPWIMAGSQYP